jgi:hypothetical protein
VKEKPEADESLIIWAVLKPRDLSDIVQISLWSVSSLSWYFFILDIGEENVATMEVNIRRTKCKTWLDPH